MPLDPGLVGRETPAQSGVITPEAIRQFVEAVGDPNPIYRDEAAARAAGFRAIPAPPTFVTRFHVDFAEAGLDPQHSQVLHGEQEYRYARPLVAGDALTVRFQIASIRQSARQGGMAIMTLEQLSEDAAEGRVATGRSTLIVRDAPDATAEPAAAPAAAPATRAKEPEGERVATLTKVVTQEQINAYAEVSGDHNPIHLDAAAARAVGLDGTIAHGMLSMAFLGQLLTQWLTGDGDAGGRSRGWVERLRVRFQAMVRPGDTLSCMGALAAGEGELRRMELWIENQRGERVISGDADVRMW